MPMIPRVAWCTSWPSSRSYFQPWIQLPPRSQRSASVMRRAAAIITAQVVSAVVSSSTSGVLVATNAPLAAGGEIDIVVADRHVAHGLEAGRRVERSRRRSGPSRSRGRRPCRRAGASSPRRRGACRPSDCPRRRSARAALAMTSSKVARVTRMRCFTEVGSPSVENLRQPQADRREQVQQAPRRSPGYP